jgi:ATP-dependent DNA helicase DinG
VNERLSIETLLAPQGILAAVLPNYETRPQQLKMARAVESSFQERRYLMAEAGTGTGKTFAYLVPAALSGRKVIVSTATKTLQEQIFQKDIPLLREKIGLKFEAAYLKGRSNYLCLHRFEAAGSRPEFTLREEAAVWPKLRQWGLETATGDRAELDLPESLALWREISTTPETCLGTGCPLYEPCFVTRARRWAEQADIVVVNHHLFFADLAIRSAGGEGVLPRYEAVIFDEAHALEEVATDYFGFQVSNFRLEDLCRDLLRLAASQTAALGLLAGLAGKLRDDGEVFFRRIPDHFGLTPSEASVRLGQRSLSAFEVPIDSILRGLAAVSAATQSAEEPELASIGRRSADLGAHLDFIRRANADDHVYWVERKGRGVLLRAAPIEIAGELRTRLYPSVDTIVFTSATLTAGGRFDYFAGRMGLAQGDQKIAPAAQISVDSPFDFDRQAALYVPMHLPEPNAPDFIDAVADEILKLVQITGGRAFALFTSLRNMVGVHQRVRARLKYQVLLQGEHPKSVLLERFKQEPSVLFASQSFWEGVDVPGDALSMVIIDRLPFASPGDPLVAARVDQLKRRGEDAFNVYQLPQAAISLRQGFGRLIRTQKDRGIMALLDKRIRTKPYGQVFLGSLPRLPRFENRSELEKWFGRLAPTSAD